MLSSMCVIWVYAIDAVIKTEFICLFQPESVKMEIVLALPKLLSKHDRYERVSLEVTDLNISEKVHSTEMIAFDHKLMWRADIFLPITSWMDRVKYRFHMVTSSKGWVGRTYTDEFSMMFEMQETNTIRQFFDRNVVYSLEVLNHLKDVVLRHSGEKSLADCMIQIEKLCNMKLHLSSEQAKWVFQTLIDHIDRKSDRQLMLCLVVFGNLFQSYFTIANSILKPETCLTLVNSLTYFKSTDASSSCIKYLFHVAEDLCRVALGKRYCFLSCISIVYPFFEETFVTNKMNEHLRRKETLVPASVDEETEKFIFSLVEKVCQRAENDLARLLLDQLILHIPLKQAAKIYIALKKIDSDLFISGVLHDSLLESIRSFLRSPKLTIDEVIQCMEMTEKIPEMATASKENLENAIVGCISTVKQNQKEVLEELILRNDLFTTEKAQLHLIKSLTSQRLPRLHFILFDLLIDIKFKEVSSKADASWFHDCFDNAILQLKRVKDDEERLEHVYKYLAKAQVCVVGLSDELVAYINTIGIEYLKLIDLRKLMRMTKMIEDLAEKDASIGDLFKGHVRTILLDQYDNNYHEMLMNLCGTLGQLRINSRYDVL